MGLLVFNFIKRSLLVPALVTALVIGGLTLYGNRAASASQSKLTPTTATEELDLSGYSSSLYDSFAELNNGDLIGTISSDAIGLAPAVICYHLDNRSEVSMAEGSTAPWESGAMLLIGADTARQLRAMHNAVTGSELTLDISGKETYQYTVTQIDTGVTEAQLENYLIDGTLAVAIPYKNLSGATAPDYYIVYSAVQA